MILKEKKKQVTENESQLTAPAVQSNNEKKINYIKYFGFIIPVIYEKYIKCIALRKIWYQTEKTNMKYSINHLFILIISL